METTKMQQCRYCGIDIVCVDGEWLDTVPDDPEPEYCAYGWVGRHRPEDQPAT